MRHLKLIDYPWRLFATALGFAVFGVGGLVMGMLIFPLMFVFVRDRTRRKRRARRWIGKAFGGFWKMLRVLGILDYRIEGREHIQPGLNQLVVANHPTLIDVVVLISLFPWANCVIKEAVTKNIFMRFVVGAADYISNREPEQLLDSCVSYLQEGGSLMLFPEGTRSKPGGELEFRAGAAAVAVRAGVDVLPVAIDCEPLFLSKEQPWYFISESRPLFIIRVLPPLQVSDVGADGAVERQLRHDFNEHLQNLIERQLRDMVFSQKPHYNA